MARSSRNTLIPISFWAVGRLVETSQVAIRFNDLQPMLMSVENAREIVAALEAEIKAVDLASAGEHPAQPPGSSGRIPKTQSSADSASSTVLRSKMKR
jgi:hypothetical protein